MDKEKLVEIVSSPDVKSNKDLNECLEILNDEFEKTKTLILSLTKHLDAVEEAYDKINNELNERFKTI
jgi:prefoldin subunit 5|tara:strand:+ start:1482 stop:1685 length:204 start_codon:yes stop_codon:yes gene_type:complete